MLRVSPSHFRALAALVSLVGLTGCAAMFEGDEGSPSGGFKSDPEDYSYNAKQYYHDREYARAKDQWTKLLELQPNSWMAKLGVGYCDLWTGVAGARTGDFDRARASVQGAETGFRSLWDGGPLGESADTPTPQAPWKAAMGLALALRGQGWIDELETRTLRRRLASMPPGDVDRNPIEPRIHELATRRETNYKASVAVLSRLVEMKSPSPDAIKNLGEMLLIVGPEQRGEALLVHWLGLAERTYEDHAKLRDEQFSELFPNLENFQQATDMMQERLDTNVEKRFSVLETLAALNWEKHRYDVALRHLEEAHELRPDRLDLLVKKAQCRGESNDLAAAVDDLDLFIRSSARSRVHWNEDVARAMRLKQDYEDRLAAVGGRR